MIVIEIYVNKKLINISTKSEIRNLKNLKFHK